MNLNKRRPRLEKPEKLKVDDNENFCVSLEHYDQTQGQNFEEWGNCKLLAKTMEVLRGFCKNKLITQVNKKKFVIYGDFPSGEKTLFTVPKYIPADAKWARIHVNGKAVVVGHVVRNKFYIVFLDNKHEFWLSEKKHT
mgnify:CR=1 FL=1